MKCVPWGHRWSRWRPYTRAVRFMRNGVEREGWEHRQDAECLRCGKKRDRRVLRADA